MTAAELPEVSTAPAEAPKHSWWRAGRDLLFREVRWSWQDPATITALLFALLSTGGTYAYTKAGSEDPADPHYVSSTHPWMIEGLSGTPARWGKDEDIPVFLSTAEGPHLRLTEHALKDAIALVRSVSSLHLRYAGVTSKGEPSCLNLFARGGVYVTSEHLPADDLAEGGSCAEPYGLGRRYVGGGIAVNQDQDPNLSGTHHDLVITLAHELCHIVGLGHSPDKSSIINPVHLSTATQFTKADREHLRTLSSASKKDIFLGR